MPIIIRLAIRMVRKACGIRLNRSAGETFRAGRGRSRLVALIVPEALATSEPTPRPTPAEEGT
jgi:hypothetical protein